MDAAVPGITCKYHNVQYKKSMNCSFVSLFISHENLPGVLHLHSENTPYISLVRIVLYVYDYNNQYIGKWNQTIKAEL